MYHIYSYIICTSIFWVQNSWQKHFLCKGCLNIHGTYVTANNSTDNNIVRFCFRFENNIL